MAEARPVDRFQGWGIVDERNAIYVPRPADRLYAATVLAGRDCHVQGSRQSGKSSLVNHGLPTFLAKGMRVAWVDLAATGPTRDISADDWTGRVVRELFRSAGEGSRRLPSLTDLRVRLHRPQP